MQTSGDVILTRVLCFVQSKITPLDCQTPKIGVGKYSAQLSFTGTAIAL